MNSGNTEEENKHALEVLKKAESGDAEALYHKGALYDQGNYVELDQRKASALFKLAADKGHAHSAWIHATELLWGLGSYTQSVDEGLVYLSKAIDAGSGEACITKARLFLFGECGHERNEAESLKYRKLAVELDDTLFDSLSNPEYVDRIQKQLDNDGAE